MLGGYQDTARGQGVLPLLPTKMLAYSMLVGLVSRRVRTHVVDGV